MLRAVSWNVNGIRAITKKGFVDIVKELDADIVCLQETKANEEQAPKELDDLEGYQRYWSSAVKKGYSGVAVFTRKDPLAVSREMGVEAFDAEGRMLKLDFDEFTLFNIYFPNGGRSEERLNFKLDFYAEFLRIVDQLHTEGKRVVVCGDVNTAHQPIDLARPKNNEGVSGFLPQERAWIDEFIAHGMVDTFRQLHPEDVKYTWWDMVTRARDRNVGWRIDYFFVTSSLASVLSSAEIHSEILGSDHCPVSIELDI